MQIFKGTRLMKRELTNNSKSIEVNIISKIKVFEINQDFHDRRLVFWRTKVLAATIFSGRSNLSWWSSSATRSSSNLECSRDQNRRKTHILNYPKTFFKGEKRRNWVCNFLGSIVVITLRRTQKKEEEGKIKYFNCLKTFQVSCFSTLMEI